MCYLTLVAGVPLPLVSTVLCLELLLGQLQESHGPSWTNGARPLHQIWAYASEGEVVSNCYPRVCKGYAHFCLFPVTLADGPQLAHSLSFLTISCPFLSNSVMALL